MTKGLTWAGMITLAAVPMAFIIVLILLVAPRKLDENIFRYKFSKIPGVVSVAEYYDYEGHRFADLRLASGRRLSIAGFDYNAFIKTSRIGLYSIGNNQIICSDDRSQTSMIMGAFNGYRLRTTQASSTNI